MDPTVIYSNNGGVKSDNWTIYWSKCDPENFLRKSDSIKRSQRDKYLVQTIQQNIFGERQI